MIDDRAIGSRRLGGMVLPRELLAPGRDTALVRPDGRPQAEFRAELRRIPSIRNALSVVGLYVQTALVLWATIRFGPWAWPIGFVLMGRAHAQFASLMHEAAHRLLFANRKANDFVGRWLLGYPSFSSTDAYRRVHMAHHRQEFGPDEPDIPLYIGYPIGAASLRRKLVRDAHRPHRPATAARAVRRASARPTGVCAARCGRSPPCRPCCSRCRSRPATRWCTRCCGSCRTSPSGVSSTGCARSPSTAASRRRATAGSPRTRSASTRSPGSCSCRTTSAGTSPTTSTPACRSATCRATTRR